MRLIDADKLLDILDVMIVGHKSASDVYDVVDSMPTVDAEPVTRCFDCKYYKDVWCYFHETILIGDEFCSFGVRREDDKSIRA